METTIRKIIAILITITAFSLHAEEQAPTAADALFSGFENESTRNLTEEERQEKVVSQNLFEDFESEILMQNTSHDYVKKPKTGKFFKGFKDESEIVATSVVDDFKVKIDSSNGSASVFFVGVENIKESADAGDIDAQLSLATHFLNGTIVDKDPKIALYYFKKAADAGNTEAAYHTAAIFQEGSVKDPKSQLLMYKYYRQAAVDNPNAMFNLGACYINGLGTRKNPIKAYFCFTMSQYDVSQAKDVLKQLKKSQGDDFVKQAEAFFESYE
ncbi:MAG: tetratricopeptide repeat protein [Opitutales bacterium]